MSFPLFLRKRRVLLLIFSCSLTYFVLKTYKQLKTRSLEDDSDDKARLRLEEILKTVKPLPGEKEQQHETVGSNLEEQRKDSPNLFGATYVDTAVVYKCRNSVQGRSIIADQNGYTCDRFDLQPNGCCKVTAPSTKRYTCESCGEHGCCGFYEQCVSCCLHPENVYVLRKVLEKQPRNINRVYSLVTDHFDLCLTKCRTSSNSVVHENSYKDSSNKYCYGYNEKRKDVNVNKGKHKIHRLHL